MDLRFAWWEIFEHAMYVLAHLSETADLYPSLMNATAKADLESDPDKMR